MTTLYVDYMYAAGQSPASIKSFGYSGVMRYLAPLPNSKVMTKAEAASLHAAGLGIGLVWEWTNNRAGAGAAAGTVDARWAEMQADALGYPGNCPIFYAIDYDVGGPAVAPYFQGIAQAARRPVGAYGPRPAVDWMIANRLAVYGWQAAGWVHGTDSNLAHLKQLVGSKLIPNTDVNEVRKPFPMWGLRGGDDDMGYSQWTQAEKDALIHDVAAAVGGQLPVANITTLSGVVQALGGAINTLQQKLDALRTAVDSIPAGGGGGASQQPLQIHLTGTGTPTP